MIRFLFFRVVVPLLFLWFLRGILRSLFGGGQRQPAMRPSRPMPNVSAGGELKKDPVCGTYVSPDASVSKRIDGQLVYFCSANCRDKYRAA